MTIIVNKIDYNRKISETENTVTTDHFHNKYITAQEFNELTVETFNARMAQTNLGSKSDIANFIKKIDLNKNAKDLINKSSILNGAKVFSSGIFQNYLVFIPAKNCIKYFSGSWKSNGMLILHQLLLIIMTRHIF